MRVDLVTASDVSQIPCTVLQGVGAKIANKLAKRQIVSVQDLLFHFPLRYQDRTRITKMAQVSAGSFVLIEGTVLTSSVQTGQRLQLHCLMSDGSGQIQLRFFHFTAQQKNALRQGVKIRCFGEIRYARMGLEMIHPEYELLDKPTVRVDNTLRPIYPSTEGLSQQMLYKLTTQALTFLANEEMLPELLPESLRLSLNLPTLKTALEYLHRPPVNANLLEIEEGRHPCQKRLILEELLANQLSLLRLKSSIKKLESPILSPRGALAEAFRAQLAFSLTLAQARVCDEIAKDIQQPRPMRRLVQGDVGSGKTVVAAMSLLSAVQSGYQAALMAPTEILTEQHAQNFTQWLTPLGIHVTCLTGKIKGKQRQKTLDLIASGEAQMIIGTHALFQDEVKFSRLGLIVIDEQHRFGVHQRLALRAKGESDTEAPHQLIMTATPIPRTLAMSYYADLDISVIDELPKGRQPIKTLVMSNDRRDEVIEKMLSIFKSGAQVYWVCTLIEDSENLTCEAAEATAALLREQLAHIRIGLVHGRMKSDEKASVMNAFKQGEIQLLVATTVIEVGVDVPNASLMIIENAERLGLAQLHQLRGRVGRGTRESYCILLYQSPLSTLARERLQTMRETQDGFKIAEKDLHIRGPGEILGTKQTGDVRLKIADLVRDEELLVEAQALAHRMIAMNSPLITPLMARWIGHQAVYVHV
jgi:ATP-dependent DNA helicase RecG